MRALSSSSRRRLVDNASVDVIRSRRLLAASVALIVDSLAGHPRANRYDGASERTARLWCFTHEQDQRRCAHDGLTCGGGTPMPGTDPTGEAATSPDDAAAALRRIDTLVSSLANAAQSLAIELAAWSPPSNDMQRPDPRAVRPPDGWCVSCWRNDRTHTSISPRPGGTSPYYADMCRWCGDFKATHGYLPPVEILRIREMPYRRVSQADIARHRPANAPRERASS